MAWRPTKYLIGGMLDNTVTDKVTGWMKFFGLAEKIVFDLSGNFHRDIRGAKIMFVGANAGPDVMEGEIVTESSVEYMKNFALVQKGTVGDITAGLPPHDYCDYPYIEWYGDENGRCVLELDSKAIKVIGKPIPAKKSIPISRQQQAQNMGKFLTGMLADAQNSHDMHDMHDQVSEN